MLPIKELRQDQNGGGGIPAFGLEPKFARRISIGALPLWRQLCCLSPRRPGKILFPDPFRVRIPFFREASPMEAGGFEPPSRYALRRASTYLVVFLFFRLPDRQTTVNRFGYSGIGLNPSARKHRREQPTVLRPNQARRHCLKGRVA